MLKKIKIQYFKSIYDQELSLGAVNAFVGANGGGKSNILEAIGVLSAAAAGRVDDEALQRRGVRPSVPRLYKSAFQENRESGFPHIFFEARTEDAAYSVSLGNTFTSPKPYWQYETEKLVSQGQTIVNQGARNEKNARDRGLAALKLVEMSEASPGAVLMNALQNYAIYTPNTPMLRGVSPDTQTREPVGLSGGRLADALETLQHLALENENIEDALEDILSLTDWMRSFDVTANAKAIVSPSVARPVNIIRFKDRFMVKKHNHLSAYDASEGALYVLFCAALALSPNAPKCFSIDNLDQALNPRLVHKLAQLLSQWVVESPDKRQILFTAHNPAVLDGLQLQNDDVRLFAVDRNNRGHTVINRVVITDELLALSKEKGWPLSRLWVMGHLGGVPNV